MRSCSTCLRLFDDGSHFCPEDGVSLGESDARLGTTLPGDFRLLAVAGRGAMGTVYRAWQIGTEREVAVKMLHDEVAAEPELVARFFREARAVARLSHPNIVTVHMVGATAEGAPFLVMELAAGESLEGELGAGPMPAARAVAIARQLASALADAHAAGIVHRDLKPANLLLEQRRRAADVLTVLDFGIAKILEPGPGGRGEPNLTREGAIFGTPQYMSPEQASGSAVDHRADLYSAGVLLYQMLAGRLPFDGSGLSLLVAHMTQPVPALPAFVEPRLARLVMRLLAKDPGDRLQSAELLLDALDDVARTALPRRARLPFDDTVAQGSAELAVEPGPERAIEPRPAPEPRSDDELTAIGFDSPRPRRRRGTWVGVASVVALFVAALAAGPEVVAGRAATATATATTATAATAPVTIAEVPRRAIMVAEGEFSLRALVPESLTAGSPQDIVLDVWGPGDRPLVADELVVIVEVDGEERGLAARPAATPGRFVLTQSYTRAGALVLRVVPPAGGASIRLHLEVGVDPSVPRS